MIFSIQVCRIELEMLAHTGLKLPSIFKHVLTAKWNRKQGLANEPHTFQIPERNKDTPKSCYVFMNVVTILMEVQNV